MLERIISNQHSNLHRLQEVVCEVPFGSFQIYENGIVSNCCFTWLPKIVGNINNSSLLEIFKNEISSKIRKSVLHGTYEYCDADLCPRLSDFLNTDRLLHPLIKKGLETEHLDLSPRPPVNQMIEVFLNYDKSCNLKFTSCRSEKILYRPENLPPALRKTHENTVKSVKELLENGFKVMLNITGSGDPFASLLYWDFLKNLQSHPNLLLRLQTNGLLMNDDRLLPVIRELTDFVNISVDAATEPTYNKVRKGGAFKKLMNNIRNFDQKVVRGDFARIRGWQLNFIVQEDNFREIVPFAEWALTHRTATNIWFNLIADWGHLSKQAFEKKAIWMKEHPYHEEFLKILKAPVLRNPKVQLGNMSSYL